MFLNHDYIRFSLKLKVAAVCKYASIAINRCLRVTLNDKELINNKKTNIKIVIRLHQILSNNKGQ